jgi:hypothetical protein
MNAPLLGHLPAGDRMWQWMDPGAIRQPGGKFPAGQTNGSCEYAYAFLCSTTLSGDKRNLPAERKPERVNLALAEWSTGLPTA